MGEVNITINNRSFKLGCDDGEEAHLLELADHLGKHVENLRQSIGKVGDEQLYLMAGLMVCDELWDTKELLVKAQKLLKSPKAQQPLEPVAAPQAPNTAPAAPLASPPPATPSKVTPSATPTAKPTLEQVLNVETPKS